MTVTATTARTRGTVIWAAHPSRFLGDRDVDGTGLDLVERLDKFATGLSRTHTGHGVLASVLFHLARRYRTTVALPLYVHEHGGVSLRAGSNLITDTTTFAQAAADALDVRDRDTTFVGLAFNVNVPAHVQRWGRLDEAAVRADVEEYAAALS